MDYNNSTRRFRPLGYRVMALSIKCDSLALRPESREERIFSSGITCMSVWEWLEWERKCSETVVDLELVLFLSTARLPSLNLSLRRRFVSPIQTNFKKGEITQYFICEEHKFARIAALDPELQELPVFATRWLNVHCSHLGLKYKQDTTRFEAWGLNIGRRASNSRYLHLIGT